ncbi:MAG: DUF2800 domain-containing protein [Clostridia bacterium]|nr:DUF2800 domain-containing protein [Clostridia bacterium]
MPDKHAFLSPSSSERWFHCTRSAWLCEQFPDLGSVFAAEGTEAHRLCEFLLHRLLEVPDVDPRPGMKYYTQEMEEAAQGYVQFIHERLERWKAAGQSPEVFVEQRVDLRMFIPESMGTSDCVIITDHDIEIIDFKYGMHRVPASSLQLRIYALGACELFGRLYEDIGRVHMVIYQPRLGSVDEAEMDMDELYHWADEELKPRAELAFAGQGDYSVGEWCRNCRARRTCRELAAHQLEIARYEFTEPPLLSDEEIADVLSRVDDLVSWATGVKEYALQAALDGRRFEGWKLVEGKSVRKFTDDACVAARVEAAGIDPYERKMLGLTALEKKLGKKDFQNLLADLVVRSQGKPTLVPVSDKRVEMNLASVEFTAENDMKEVNENE